MLTSSRQSLHPKLWLQAKFSFTVQNSNLTRSIRHIHSVRSNFHVPKQNHSSAHSNSWLIKHIWSQKRSFTTKNSPDDVESPQTPPATNAPLGNVFDLTPEQYAELSRKDVPDDFKYQTFTDPSEAEDEEIFEPKFLDIPAITELMVRGRYSAAIKKGSSILEPHKSIIASGFPSHDPALHQQLRYEIAQTLALLSNCYLNIGKTEEALESSKTAASLYPICELYSDWASQLLSAEKYEEAIAVAQIALDLDPYKEVDALITKAYALDALGKYDHDIIGLCNLALARDPYATAALKIKSRVQAHFGKYRDSIHTIDRALSRDDQDWDLIGLKSKCLQELGQRKNALQVVLKFLEEDSENMDAKTDVAKLSLLTKNWEVAERYLPEVIEATGTGRPDLVKTYVHLQKFDQAKELLEKAKSLGDSTSIVDSEKPVDFRGLKRQITIMEKKAAKSL